MSNDVSLTITGNVARDVDLKFLSSGKAVASFSVAVNERKKEGDKWVDGDPSFFEVKCWDQMAENVSESLSKGNRVIVKGVMRQENWTNDQGEKRSKMVTTAESVGPDLRFATAQVVRNERSGNNRNSGGTPSQSEVDALENPYG